MWWDSHSLLSGYSLPSHAWLAIAAPVVCQIAHVQVEGWGSRLPPQHLLPGRTQGLSAAPWKGKPSTHCCPWSMEPKASTGLALQPGDVAKEEVMKIPVPPALLGWGCPYLARSLNEMGELPGGALRTFWDPVYSTSISAWEGPRALSRTLCPIASGKHRAHSTHAGVGAHRDPCATLALRFSPCWSMRMGAPPSDATASTSSKQLCLEGDRTQPHSPLQPSPGGVPRHTDRWHSSPRPSSGCRTPVEDSPWVMKITEGLCCTRP